MNSLIESNATIEADFPLYIPWELKNQILLQIKDIQTLLSLSATSSSNRTILTVDVRRVLGIATRRRDALNLKPIELIRRHRLFKLPKIAWSVLVPPRALEVHGTGDLELVRELYNSVPTNTLLICSTEVIRTDALKNDDVALYTRSRAPPSLNHLSHANLKCSWLIALHHTKSSKLACLAFLMCNGISLLPEVARCPCDPECTCGFRAALEAQRRWSQ